MFWDARFCRGFCERYSCVYDAKHLVGNNRNQNLMCNMVFVVYFYFVEKWAIFTLIL